MADTLKIGVVLGSTRTGRFSDQPADWVLELGKKHDGVQFERIDLRDYPMPFFDESKSPFREPASHEVAKRFAKKIGELDGFVFVTGEYNHSIPAVLKNALDHVYAEWNRKPAGYVAYGGIGGARAVESLRLMLIELQMAPVRFAVHIVRQEYLDLALKTKTFADFPHLTQMGQMMLDDLIWWTRALKTARATT